MPEWLVYFNIIASVLWISQIIFSFFLHRKHLKFRNIQLDHIPKLSVIVPVFNESNHKVQKVIDSIVMQRHVEVEIVVMDDGSFSPLKLNPHSRVRYLRTEENKGKRHAQIEAIKHTNMEWIVTVDSDTILQPDALYELYKSSIVHNWDAVSGHVKLLNERYNVLTRMTACLYWYGFCQERAYQGYFGQVTCCSGALALWRRDTILQTADLYLNQQFMGKECRAGDDRFLTCLFALSNKKVGFAESSVAYTVSPPALGGFIKQQLRWTRSNTPAFIFTLFNWRKISVLFNVLMFGVMFRYLYFIILYVCTVLALALGYYAALLYVFLSILVVSALKSINAFLYTREWKMFLLMPLSILSFFMLSPVVIYGALTPTQTGWLTRTKKDSLL